MATYYEKGILGSKIPLKFAKRKSENIPPDKKCGELLNGKADWEQDSQANCSINILPKSSVNGTGPPFPIFSSPGTTLFLVTQQGQNGQSTFQLPQAQGQLILPLSSSSIVRPHLEPKMHIATVRSKEPTRKVRSKKTRKKNTSDIAAKVFECKYCESKFAHFRNVSSHVKKFHQDKSINATTEDNINYEQITIGVDKVFVCQYCDSRFKNESTIQKHIRNIHPGKMVSQEVSQNDCDICGQSYSNLKKLIYHKSRVHNTRRYTCNICDKLFKHRCSLNRHLKEFHPDLENKDVWSVKNIHRDTNTKKKNIKCEICNKLFSTNRGLNKHMEEIHSVAVTKQSERRARLVRCWIKDCSAKFQALHQLRVHLMEAEDAGGHNWIIEKEEKVFDNFEEFNQWKEDVEENENLRYVRKMGPILELRIDGSIKRTYHCSRSGKYTKTKSGKQENKKQTQATSSGFSHQPGHRRLFKKGTSKIGHYCPSSMDVHLSSLGTVTCTFFKTHGHDTANNIMHIPIHKRDRQFIIDKIGQGVEPKNILYDLHKKGGRSAMIGHQDIKNYTNLHGKNKPHLLGQENGEIYVSNIETLETEVVEHESIPLYSYEMGEQDYLISETDDRNKVLSEAQTVLSGLSRTLNMQSGKSIDCIKAVTQQIKIIDNAVQSYQLNNVAEQSSMPVIPN